MHERTVLDRFPSGSRAESQEVDRCRSRRSERTSIPAATFSASEDVLLFDAVQKNDAHKSMHHHHSKDAAENAHVDGGGAAFRPSISAQEEKEKRDGIEDEERGSVIVSIDDDTESSIDIFNSRSAADSSSERTLCGADNKETRGAVTHEALLEKQESIEKEPPRQGDVAEMVVDEMSSLGTSATDGSLATKCFAAMEDPSERLAIWEPSCAVDAFCNTNLLKIPNPGDPTEHDSLHRRQRDEDPEETHLLTSSRHKETAGYASLTADVNDLPHEDAHCARGTRSREATDVPSHVMSAEESGTLEMPFQREASSVDAYRDVNQRYLPIQAPSRHADNDALDDDDGDVVKDRSFDRLSQLLALLRRQQMETQVNDLCLDGLIAQTTFPKI